jgi:hypothetical protein
MTQVTVHTDFTDLNQMAQGLVGRVNDTHVILPGPDPVDVGEWVQFEVTLYDGTPGFAGVGRCVTVVDNGEERLSHQRFDVVIDNLQFDPRGQQVFEHILTLNGTGEEAAEAGSYGEATASYAEDASFEDVSADFTGSKIEIPQAPSYQEYSNEEEATVIGDSQAFAGAAAVGSDLPPPARSSQVSAPPPPAPISYSPVDEEQDELVDETPPSLRAGFTDASAGSDDEVPQAVSAPPPAPHVPMQVNGAAFSYPQGLTFPDKPPRPELDATRRVSRAPRPR